MTGLSSACEEPWRIASTVGSVDIGHAYWLVFWRQNCTRAFNLVLDTLVERRQIGVKTVTTFEWISPECAAKASSTILTRCHRRLHLRRTILTRCHRRLHLRRQNCWLSSLNHIQRKIGNAFQSREVSWARGAGAGRRERTYFAQQRAEDRLRTRTRALGAGQPLSGFCSVTCGVDGFGLKEIEYLLTGGVAVKLLPSVRPAPLFVVPIFNCSDDVRYTCRYFGPKTNRIKPLDLRGLFFPKNALTLNLVFAELYFVGNGDDLVAIAKPAGFLGSDRGVI